MTVALLFELAGNVTVESPSPTMVCASGTGVASGAAAGVGVASTASSLPERTETLPLNAGIDISRADSMNVIAAPMVNFAKTDAVPRGANAVLETLLVNRAPASVLPGCSSTDAISMKHEMKNKAYKM